MPGPRRKAPRQLAPQTIAEATERLAEYADILLGVEELQQDADASIAAIQAERDRMIAPLEQKAKDLFLQLRAWWGVAGDELTEGKRKSVELAGCVLGERTTPPSLSTGKMKVAEAIAEIERLASIRLRDGGKRAAALRELIRIKRELDKPAILKALTDERLGKLLTDAGFTAKQKDEFFIDRAGPKPAAVQEVTDPEVGEDA